MVVAAAVYDRRLRSIVGSAPTRARREEGHMKTFGNLILMTVICIVIFWVFMALRPADAARIRCGSSWEICAQRGKGPGLSHPIIRDNIRRALIDPNRGSNRDEKATPNRYRCAADGNGDIARATVHRW